MQISSTEHKRFETVQTLRGIAALIVAWGHFCLSNKNLNLGVFRYTALNPDLGVQIFFVISGFILPYSLWKGRYNLAQFGRFVAKRVIRLDPPYFVAIAIALALQYSASRDAHYRGAPFALDWAQIGMHAGYMNVIFHKPWIVSVFWTLAVEFQFYLTLGLTYPLLNSTRRWAFPLFVALCAISQAFLFDRHGLLPYHWPAFLMGITAFRYKIGRLDKRAALLWLAALCVWSAFGIYRGAIPGAAAGLITALLIIFVEYGGTVTTFFGTISYSLYLLHQPIGSRICNLGARFAHNPVTALGVALAAMVVSCGAAYLLYLAVEKPSQRWAGAIKYRNDMAFRKAA